ncbi:MAG: NRDE family protein [Deltaproteobacteria bacterium]|nr:NRDE family protein [Deltaproteobacteria bacterium]
MCTLVLYFRVFPQYPLVIVANRDESLTRPSTPPTLLNSVPCIYGGQDLLAGGTWLGINAHGLMAAVLNRRALNPADPQRRSRGLLCLDSLKHTSISAAQQWISTQAATQYNSFSLVIADPSVASFVYPDDHALRVRSLPPGVYMLTNLDPNDPDCPRISRFSQRFLQLSHNPPTTGLRLQDLFAQLHHLLADHASTQDPRTGLCLHLDGYGTCSSSLLAYSRSENRYVYLFASGPPCQSTYKEVLVPSGSLTRHPPSTK